MTYVLINHPLKRWS